MMLALSDVLSSRFHVVASTLRTRRQHAAGDGPLRRQGAAVRQGLRGRGHRAPILVGHSLGASLADA